MIFWQLHIKIQQDLQGLVGSMKSVFNTGKNLPKRENEPYSPKPSKPSSALPPLTIKLPKTPHGKPPVSKVYHIPPRTNVATTLARSAMHYESIFYKKILCEFSFLCYGLWVLGRGRISFWWHIPHESMIDWTSENIDFYNGGNFESVAEALTIKRSIFYFVKRYSSCLEYLTFDWGGAGENIPR